MRQACQDHSSLQPREKQAFLHSLPTHHRGRKTVPSLAHCKRFLPGIKKSSPTRTAEEPFMVLGSPPFSKSVEGQYGVQGTMSLWESHT